MDNVNVQTGIEYYKSGNKTGALKIFLEVLKREPNNEIAWLWLAACVDKPEQKKDCFHKVLKINPNNEVAQKALVGLELQAVSDTKPVLKSGTVLKCPSCGSAMGKPDHTGLVQCSYCGTNITYHPPVERVERKNVERFLEICKAALEGSNHDEALQYANRVLEIDPENSSAWIYKAVATFWLTTVANNRYDEAMGYLQRAELIEKDNLLIQETRDSLTRGQVQWFIHLGEQELENAIKVAQIYTTHYDLSSALSDSLLGHPEAKEKSQEYFIKAMNYFIVASHYDPTHYYVLNSIRNIAREANWISWSSEVRNKVAFLQRMEQRDQAIESLPNLRKQLQEAQSKLAKLKKEKGFFTGMKIDSAASKVKSLKQQIAQYEHISNSELK